MLFYLTCFLCLGSGLGEEFRFASIFSSKMVLQREPHSPSVWGFGPPGSTVSLSLTGPSSQTPANYEGVVGDDGVWSVSLGSWPAGTGYSLQANNSYSGNNQSLTLTDLAFGEVWLCSGQSNMAFVLKSVRDAEEEIAAAAMYQDLRLLKISTDFSETPLDEVLGFDSDQWITPSVEFLSGASFSSICLFFGQQLNDQLGVPIGLIDSAWGGTIIEAWSPPQVIQECGVEDEGVNEENNHNVFLWNSMIHPLLRMTIKGAIWYQGESNTGHNREIYDCTFVSLIKNWRENWYESTGGDTERIFPFGFVQLAPSRNTTSPNWPVLRWKQTANYGFTPNPVMENVFMAAAIDDDIDLHPKNKRLPATRLGWAGLHLVYGQTSLPLYGPQPQNLSLAEDRTSLTITFSQSLKPVLVEEDRFMVCCLETSQLCDSRPYEWSGLGWQGVVITGMKDTHTVELDTSMACGGQPHFSALAYLWLQVPCSGEEQCPLYSDDQYNMPVAPFKIDL